MPVGAIRLTILGDSDFFRMTGQYRGFLDSGYSYILTENVRDSLSFKGQILVQLPEPNQDHVIAKIIEVVDGELQGYPDHIERVGPVQAGAETLQTGVRISTLHPDLVSTLKQEIIS